VIAEVNGRSDTAQSAIPAHMRAGTPGHASTLSTDCGAGGARRSIALTLTTVGTIVSVPLLLLTRDCFGEISIKAIASARYPYATPLSRRAAGGRTTASPG
jgi:hypothetical protein